MPKPVRRKRLRRYGPIGGRDAPDGIAGVIGDEQGSRSVHGKTDRSATGLVPCQEAGHDILSGAGWTPVGEGDED
jgi:hypothetical protein